MAVPGRAARRVQARAVGATSLAMQRAKQLHQGSRAARGLVTAAELSSRTERTQEQYDQYVKIFRAWQVSNCRVNLPLEMDLLDFVDDAMGTGRPPPSAVEKIVAAVLAATPGSSRRSMPRLTTALSGFKKIHPPLSREPLPMELVAAVIAVSLARGRRSFALFVMTALAGYFRPGELRRMRVADLRGPSGGLQEGLEFWTLTVAPRELAVASKTQTFDDTVVMDKPVWLGPMLGHFIAGRPLPDPLFPLSEDETVDFWKEALVDLLMVAPLPVLYQLRHAGVTADLLAKFRSPIEAQARGRWATTVCLRRYVKPGVVQKALAKLHPATRSYARAAFKNLELLL